MKTKLLLALLILFVMTGHYAISQETEGTDTASIEEETQPSPERGADLFRQVTGLENWQYDYDISGYNKGKYNLIIKGIDRAGNVYFEGPIDILVDPDSDLPVVNISNPIPDMRVGGKLNIVGTCVDDDGVAKVEVKINDGDFMEADGTDFWSLYLDTSDFEDGAYTITARGIDTNDVIGKEYSVVFNLDKEKPVNTIVSHENGMLISGKVTFEGTISDLNGISELSYSTDGGQIYEKLSFKGKKQAPEVNFKLNINTIKLSDGPQVYWFRSVDKMGSVGLSAFLFFVDNKPPQLNILYPTEDFQENGKFNICGQVFDEVGIEKMTWERGKDDPVEIVLSPGNGYWVHEFDFSGQNRTDVVFTLTDRAGNRTTKKLQLKLDTDVDLPLLEMQYPLADSIVFEDRLSGFVSDDDGVQGIIYSLDGGDEQRVATGQGFNLTIPALEAGSHKLDIRAVDINGVEGKPVRINFTKGLDKPLIEISSVVQREGEPLAFSPGMEIIPESHKAITGFVTSHNPLQGVTFQFNGSDPLSLSLKKTDQPEKKRFSLALPDEMPNGFVELVIQAQDKYGREEVFTTYIIVGPLEEKGIFMTDRRFKESNETIEGNIKMAEQEEIIGLISGGGISSISLEPESDLFSVSHQGNIFNLRAKTSGFADNLSIVVETVDGNIFKAGPFSIAVDLEPPEIDLTEEVTGLWVNEEVIFAGTLKDNLAVDILEYALGKEGNFQPVAIEKNDETSATDLPFTIAIPLADVPDGNVYIRLKASDRAGNTVTLPYLVRKDSTPPQVEQITPVAADTVNGLITICGRIEDDSPVDSVEFSDDGELFVPVTAAAIFSHDIDLAAYEELPEKFFFRITDRGGNRTLFSPELNIDLESDKPVVQIQIPEEGILIRSDFIISGMVFDDDSVKTIYYRLDDDEFKELEGSNNFEIPIRLADIDDNKHIIEVKAEDIGGVFSDVAVSWFMVSKTEPISQLNTPSLEETVKDTLVIQGESSDANGIKEVFVSFDNGNTFNRMDGTENWSYSLDTNILEDGICSLLIRAVDSTDVEGLYTTLINLDNTAPELELAGPYDGQQVTGSFRLTGRVNDSIALAGLVLEITPLGGGASLAEEEAEEEQAVNEGNAEAEAVATADKAVAPVEPVVMDLPSDEVILQEIDVSFLPQGWYNLRLTAKDRADNSVYITRNIKKIVAMQYSHIDIFFPVQGEMVAGEFLFQGRIQSSKIPDRVTLNVDGNLFEALEVTEHGYFSFSFKPEHLTDGSHIFQVEAVLADGDTIKTPERRVEYSRQGPWIIISNFIAGDFASQRPWIEGKAGYPFSSDPEDKAATKKLAKVHEIDRIEVSLDNGKTFRKAKGKDDWRFRLETQDLHDGVLNVLARARFRDNRVAVAKTQLIVDDTPPEVTLIFPEEGMRFNDSISLSGIASDASGLQDVSVALRKGGKSRYQVPGFIQGLYIDTHFLGATHWDVGAGLTFFDDNVKLQLQLGTAPVGRFSGLVIGAKLLANVAVLPYGYFFGANWDFLSSSIAVGANFSYFTMSEDSIAFTSDGLVLGSIIGQLVLARVQVPGWKLFNSFSLYTEAQLWFISSDIAAGTVTRIAFGLRTEVF